MSTPRIISSLPTELCEENCACPDGGFEPIRVAPEHSASLWQIAPKLYRAALAQDHQVVFDPMGFSNVVVLNAPAQELLYQFNTPRTLTDVTFQDDLPLAERTHALQSLITLGLVNPVNTPHMLRSSVKTLTAWLHVTNACNLRCTYCYFHKTNAAMDEATGRAAVDAVFRSAVQNHFQEVKLKYAGGEATLNFELVRALHGYAKERAAESGLQLHEVVLSNGVALTRPMIEFLRDEQIRLMISLDGIGETHDVQRVFINGTGSFKQVAKGIERALAYGLSPHLSVTVTAHNAGTLPDVVHFALDRDLLFNLNFYRENDCVGTHAELAADQSRIIAGMKAAFAVIEERLPRRRVIDGLVDRSSFAEPHEFACGAGHNYMVIDEHGSVARCQMEIERPLTTVMVEDPLAEIRRARDGFLNIPVSAKMGCADCEWKMWCAGGCSLLTFRATGRTDVQSPYCNVYKALYPDVVRLEGLRLLKYASLNA